jgi:hypothetical protein
MSISTLESLCKFKDQKGERTRSRSGKTVSVRPRDSYNCIGFKVGTEVQILAEVPSSCITLGKSLNFPVSCSYLEDGNTVTCPVASLGDWDKGSKDDLKTVK